MLRSKYGAEIARAVARLEALGHEVSLHNTNGVVRLCSKDGSRNLSALYSPKEFIIFITGYEQGVRDEHSRYISGKLSDRIERLLER